MDFFQRIIPSELTYHILSHCDLQSLQSFGLTSRKAASFIFVKNNKLRNDLLDALREKFEKRLQQQLVNGKRVQLDTHYFHKRVHLIRAQNGKAVAMEDHCLSVYASITSFLQNGESDMIIAKGGALSRPVIYENKIFFSDSRSLYEYDLDSNEVQHSIRLRNNIWSTVVLPALPYPSLLVFTTTSLLHFPYILAPSSDKRGAPFRYTCQSLTKTGMVSAPATTAWDEGGCLVGFKEEGSDPRRPAAARILAFHEHIKFRSLGSVQLPADCQVEHLTLHKSGLLVVACRPLAEGSRLYAWKIQPDGNHVLVLRHDSKRRQVFIALEFVGRTLIGITERSHAVTFRIVDGLLVYKGETRLARRHEEGLLRNATIWPSRGSVLLWAEKDLQTNSLHEWVVEPAFCPW